MFSKTKLVLASLLVVALLALGIGGAIAFAQGPTATPPKSWGDLYQQVLASKLGIGVDKLQQTMTDARKEALAQAVKQGLLTQAQADRLQNAPAGGPGLGNRGVVDGAIRTAALDAAAKTLGMTSADVTTALKGGKTLLDLAREKNVDVTKLRTAIADAEKAAIDQAVKDGKLTQAQADALKANIKPENIDLTRKFQPMMPGRGAGQPPMVPGGRMGKPGR
jgi:hypothetical protein